MPHAHGFYLGISLWMIFRADPNPLNPPGFPVDINIGGVCVINSWAPRLYSYVPLSLCHLLKTDDQA